MLRCAFMWPVQRRKRAMETSYGILKIVGVFGVALGLMAYELISLRKSMREENKSESAETKNGTRPSTDV
ncbi:MAG: hypothetical protein CTY31_04415 [Hyphomicrobium sp.]|nr:MAG: hypothetical protein CTY31_04415 [Hyphomicrobium sp.]